MLKKYLITTCIEENYLNSKKIVPLGDWCLNSNSIKKINKINKLNFESKAYYINNLTKRLSLSLAHYLNKANRTNYKKEFWQNFIWVWLQYYLSAYYYRWNQVQKVSKKEKLYYINFTNQKYIYIKNTTTFYELVSTSDYFNYLLINKIIHHMKKKFNFVDKKKRENTFDLNKNLQNKLSFKDIFLIIYSFIFSKIIKKNKIFITSVFNFKNLIKINLKLSQLPGIFSYFFKDKKYFFFMKDKLNRNPKNFNFKHTNTFENFIKKNIINDIPLDFLENFKESIIKLDKINLNPNTILCAGEHYHNDKFKLWSLLRRHNHGCKIIVSEHGGNHQYNSNLLYKYDKMFSDQNILWIKKYNKKELPNPKIFENFIIRNKNCNKITYVGFEKKKFPCRVAEYLHTSDDDKTFKNLEYIKKRLRGDLYDRFFYAPKNIKDQRLQENIFNLLSKKKILKNQSFQKNLQKSKMVICDYPQTAFIEALSTGPTFLVCDYKKIFKPLNYFKRDYELLRKNKVIFDNINTLIKYLNHNWDNIDVIWNSQKKQRVIENFLKKFCVKDQKSLITSWGSYLKKIKNVS